MKVYEFIENRSSYKKFLIPRHDKPENNEFMEVEISKDTNNNLMLRMIKLRFDKIPNEWQESSTHFTPFTLYSNFIHEVDEEFLVV